MFQKLIWCCTCCNCYTRMFQVFHLFSDYIANILSECFKSISCVVGHRAPVAAGAPSWFTCRSLRPADTSTACIHKQGRWVQSMVSLCGREMDVRARFYRAGCGMSVGRGSRLWRWLGMGRSVWDVMRA
jgi:hypothetical protein